MATPAPFATIDGYVADSAYPSNFHQEFQPPWTDAILVGRGIAAPDAPFTLVDLGCGDGLGLIAMAASFPQARFIGVDAMSGHIARGQALAAEIGLPNVEFHAADFFEAQTLADGAADYVISQGVLAWVSGPNREALLDLAARWLKPGGAFSVGYNAFPGWTGMMAFQKLVRTLVENLTGNSGERFRAAIALARGTGAVGADVWSWLDGLLETLPPDYFAHEYLNGHWGPCWSGDVIAAAAERGLHFVGQANPGRVRDDLCLKAEWRAELDALPSLAAREIAADMLVDCWFRQDVCVKGTPARMDGEALRQARARQHWTLICDDLEEAGWSATTPAGTIRFDNPAAQALVARLRDGPSALGEVKGFGLADMANAADVLFIARKIVAVGPASAVPFAAAANARFGREDVSLNALAGPHGAIAVGRKEARTLPAKALKMLGLDLTRTSD